MNTPVDQVVDAWTVAVSASVPDGLILPSAGNDWLAVLETRLPGPLPAAFRSLVMRYDYVDVEIGGVWLYDNVPEESPDNWRTRVFADPYLSPFLLTRGLIAIGQPEYANYDPICLDTARTSGEDCPLVRIDHEDVLCRDRLRVVQEIAPSFGAWMNDLAP